MPKEKSNAQTHKNKYIYIHLQVADLLDRRPTNVNLGAPVCRLAALKGLKIIIFYKLTY